MLDQSQIDAIRRRAEQSTPIFEQPAHIDNPAGIPPYVVPSSHYSTLFHLERVGSPVVHAVDRENHADDAAFIAHARRDIFALLTEREQLLSVLCEQQRCHGSLDR
jgi:hypothetical protein